MSSEIYEQFKQDFFPLLGSSARWTAFDFIMKELSEKKHPAVIETGTLRQPGNWIGDGQSTRLWNWLAAKTSGFVVSVDISSDYCSTASRLCPHIQVRCQDSISFLRGFLPINADLLYLDAYDYSPGNELNSMFHHVGELAAVWDRLPSGCLIAIDDCISENQGKHALVKVLFDSLGVSPALSGYITIWKKP